MRHFNRRRPALVAAVGTSAIIAIALAASAAPARSAGHAPRARDASQGGLSVSPGIFEHPARRGGLGSIEVSNTTAAAMAVKIALRPWLQARSGEVSPNRRRTLHGVRPSASSFTLAAGASKSVAISLRRVPRGRSQYGAIEVTGGAPGRATGVRLAYRLVESLRLDAPPGRRTFRARPRRLIEQGSVKHGALLMAVRNAGNTIDPIGGTVAIGGSGRSLHARLAAKAIVPGHTVNVLLAQLLGSLPRGRYRVAVHLVQAGHRLGTVNRTIVLR